MSKDLIQDSLVVQVAALSFAKTPEYKIAEALGISRHQVKKIRNSEEFAAYLQEIADRAVKNAVNEFKSKFEELEPLAFEALRANLEDKKLEAVKVWAGIAGVKGAEAGDGGGVGTIQVILPGAGEKPVIEVSGETRDGNGSASEIE
jgi:hypothetical protein